jgi:hypothetical protein
MSTLTMDTMDAQQLERVAQWEADLLSGRIFRLQAIGARSRIGYQPPSRSDEYAIAIGHLAKGAQLGDRQAKLCARVIRALPLNNTDGDTIGKMYDAAAEAITDEFFDTIGAASPEPGRHSDNAKEFTLRDALVFYNTLNNAKSAFEPVINGGGWCYAALVAREGVRVLEDYPLAREKRNALRREVEAQREDVKRAAILKAVANAVAGKL